ncbi:hypothetical protein B0H17DRAFT_1069429 [Mycena rosella]|uniref:FAD/NAD(P)-binding domain-containing protein n=1 Tax=Mycena rosella TaxID=1033263 RepID=A0AAD7GCA8_MYCRO|nr:hypothetical protein B0H17DRAFT_1069429 [Mycena rosella]
MVTKTVVVLGASYGGAHAAQLIAAGLLDDWRIILIDRNSHVNHVYILPRLAVLPGHEHKAFVPCDNIFNLPAGQTDPKKHILLHAQVLFLSAHAVTLSRAFPEHDIDTVLSFDFAVYALGSHLPPPLDLWGEQDAKAAPYGGTKPEGIAWLKRAQEDIAAARSVLVVGGGALGIQFATDIAAIHPTTSVTLLHSRTRLLPRFDERMHSEILQALESAGITVVLDERLAPAIPTEKHGVHHTTTGRKIEADLLLRCTGQVPNTALLRALDVRVVEDGSGQARVLRTMQLAVTVPEEEDSSQPGPEPSVSEPAPEPTLEQTLAQLALSSDAAEQAADDTTANDAPDATTPYPHLFAVGDAAAAFGAVPAGHNAYYQAGVAARNVLRLVRRAVASEAARHAEEESRGRSRFFRGRQPAPVAQPPQGEEEDAELERYEPGAPAVKVSLGLTKNVYEVAGAVGVGKETREDLNAAAIWGYFGCPVAEGEADAEGGEGGMYR